MRVNSGTASGGTGSGALVVAGGIGVGSTSYFSTLYSSSLNETSSMAIKENINPIENALEKILQLEGVTYDRIDDHRFEAGLIAEHVNMIIPELVGKDANGNPDSVMYSKLTAYLIEAVKTLKLEIDELKGN